MHKRRIKNRISNALIRSNHDSLASFEKSEINSINNDLDCVLVNNKNKSKS